MYLNTGGSMNKDDLNLLYSKKLLFADDMKLFHIIRNTNDISLLQKDLNILASWCDINKLPFNFDKCKIMTFTRPRNSTQHTYNIHNYSLLRVNKSCDLGIIIESDLSFNRHIQHIISKSCSLLGFITRNCKKISKTVIGTLKIIFMSLVRSKLEYNSAVWFPYLNTHI